MYPLTFLSCFSIQQLVSCLLPYPAWQPIHLARLFPLHFSIYFSLSLVMNLYTFHTSKSLGALLSRRRCVAAQTSSGIPINLFSRPVLNTTMAMTMEVILCSCASLAPLAPLAPIVFPTFPQLRVTTYFQNWPSLF